jgi:hypothetical protein
LLPAQPIEVVRLFDDAEIADSTEMALAAYFFGGDQEQWRKRLLQRANARGGTEEDDWSTEQ